jgi:hypothetical protein
MWRPRGLFASQSDFFVPSHFDEMTLILIVHRPQKSLQILCIEFLSTPITNTTPTISLSHILYLWVYGVRIRYLWDQFFGFPFTF